MSSAIACHRPSLPWLRLCSLLVWSPSLRWAREDQIAKGQSVKGSTGRDGRVLHGQGQKWMWHGSPAETRENERSTVPNLSVRQSSGDVRNGRWQPVAQPLLGRRMACACAQSCSTSAGQLFPSGPPSHRRTGKDLPNKLNKLFDYKSQWNSNFGKEQVFWKSVT